MAKKMPARDSRRLICKDMELVNKSLPNVVVLVR
jgi:hypothetical protein